MAVAALPVGAPETTRVLVVVDDERSRESLVRLLAMCGHASDIAAGVQEARAALQSSTYELVLVDLYLPDGSGLRVARELGRWPSPPAVVMVSAEDDVDLARIAMDAGAYGYLTKPFGRNDVAIAVDNALRRQRRERKSAERRMELEDAVVDRTAALHDAMTRMRLAQEETILRLSHAIELRDSGSAAHIERVSRVCAIVGGRLGLDGDALRVASRLHDIGNVAVPDGILRKPGPLTGEERAQMERHTEVGHDLLRGSRSQLLDLAAEIALTHHERFDGSGYPRGIAADEIPLAGRVAAVAEVFDALTSPRRYRTALSVEHAVSVLEGERGRQFDPAVVDAFLAVLPEITAALGEVETTGPEPPLVAADLASEPRLLTLREAAAAVGVSPSTMRRWADDGRIKAVRTSGGHRRFLLDDVRGLAAEQRPQATVRPLTPPSGPLPLLADQIGTTGVDLRGAAVASLYHGGPAGWFGSDAAIAPIRAWIDTIVDGARSGDHRPAVDATLELMRRAELQGTTRLERHRFLDRFGEAAVRSMSRAHAPHTDLLRARRLFVSMQQALLNA